MFEIGDAARRERVHAGLGGVEETFSITIADAAIAGVAEADVDRTNAVGKASSVQFVHFRFTPGQIAALRSPEGDVGVGHPSYAHMAVMPANVRAAVAGDFD